MKMHYKLVHIGEDYIGVKENGEYIEMPMKCLEMFLPETTIWIDTKEINMKELRKFIKENF